MTFEIVLNQTYPYPPEHVWRALTDRESLAAWLMPNDFEARVGHKFRFQAKPIPGWRGFVECEVIEVQPPWRLAYTWVGDAHWQEPTVVRWTLESVAGGTRLRLEHTNLQEPWGRELKAMLSQGWKGMIDEKIPRVLTQLGPIPGSQRG